jgi:hypothetical protein
LRVVYYGWNVRQIPDEFASLLSLLSGTRLAAGENYIRRFDFDGDPLGEPIFTHETLVVPKRWYGESIGHLAERRGIELPLLQALPYLSPVETLTLAKAARLYRIALWYSASQEEYTWLMLVSALETAAAYWQKSRVSPEEQLQELRPRLRELLLSAGGVELLKDASAELADYMGATRKFITFVSTFLPDVATSINKLKDLREVYGARSRALHSGTPIPTDLAMSLSDFEVVTRGALIGWWRSMVRGSRAAGRDC